MYVFAGDGAAKPAGMVDLAAEARALGFAAGFERQSARRLSEVYGNFDGILVCSRGLVLARPSAAGATAIVVGRTLRGLRPNRRIHKPYHMGNHSVWMLGTIAS